MKSIIGLANGLISGHAVTDFRDTLYGRCSLLNVHVHCDGETASCVGEYIDSDGDLVGVSLRFACPSMKKALDTMFSMARHASQIGGIENAVLHLASSETDVYDYSVNPMSDDYRWFDFSEIA